jgi:hypothetical protein
MANKRESTCQQENLWLDVRHNDDEYFRRQGQNMRRVKGSHLHVSSAVSYGVLFEKRANLSANETSYAFRAEEAKS